MFTENEGKLIAFIERSVVTNTVRRTTEVGLIAQELNLPRQEVSDMVGDLVKRGDLKCATETWHDYCYIVPPSIALPSHLEWCNPFGL